MSKIDLWQGDCLELMKNIPDKSVDMILCDLPYGTTACKWDNVIPFEPLWEQYNRVIKDNGAIVLFGSQPFSSYLLLSNPTQFREELIWLKNKPASGMQKNQKHLKIHENIYIFSKKTKYIYNPQKWLVEDKEFLTQRKTFKENEYIGNNIYGKTTRTRKPDDGTRFPISILSCKTPFTSSNSKKYRNNIEIRVHPTQKPLALLEYLIKTYTNEGETVLDNCMGSGSTGVACVNTNRNFIGIELDPTYFAIAKTRIENDKEYLAEFEHLTEDKEDAEELAEFGNITRTDKMPFIKWEDFIQGKELFFHDDIGMAYRLCRTQFSTKPNMIYLFEEGIQGDYISKKFELSRDGYRNALKICVKLFRGDSV